jgi:hypothetical protein
MTDPDDFHDLDLLMSIDPLELSKQDLTRIIAYQRKQRVQREQGVRTRKPKAAPAVSIEELLSTMVQPAPAPTAPGKGFRRF